MLRSASLRKQALDNGKGSKELWRKEHCAGLDLSEESAALGSLHSTRVVGEGSRGGGDERDARDGGKEGEGGEREEREKRGEVERNERESKRDERWEGEGRERERN